MIRIKCINPNCNAPEGKFAWDDRAHTEGGLAQAGEHGAIAFIVECPYCGAENKIWLHKAKRSDSVTRGRND